MEKQMISLWDMRVELEIDEVHLDRYSYGGCYSPYYSEKELKEIEYEEPETGLTPKE